MKASSSSKKLMKSENVRIFYPPVALFAAQNSAQIEAHQALP